MSQSQEHFKKKKKLFLDWIRLVYDIFEAKPKKCRSPSEIISLLK